jgi:hypothetical protein
MISEQSNLLPIIAVGLVIAAIGTYYILRYLKGSITIFMPGTSFRPGDTVAGSFELLTRKDIRANNLTASLVATETTRRRGYNGKSTTHTEEIYRGGQTLEHAKDYPAGFTATYNFKIPVPQGRTRAASDSMLGQAMEMLGGLGRRVSWSVEVRLDAEGVDLAASQKIAVDDGGAF